MLNDLMKSLCIPIPIVSPIDLTPSLLFAILESLLGQKLPIPSGSIPQDRRMLKIQKIKLFLGVLETDILQEDVGLSRIDPRRLAVGEWHEASFVARVLCMVGQRLGLLSLNDRADKTSQKKRSSSPITTPGALRKVSDPPMRSSATRRSPQDSRYSTPELDTTSVFYVPSSSNTRDTQTTTASLFEDSLTNESTRTTPDPFFSETRPKTSNQQVDTPSSVALSLLPPFQSPLPRNASPPYYTRDIPSPSLLLSVDDPSLYSLRNGRPRLSPPPSKSAVNASFTPSSVEQESKYSRKIPVRYSGYIEPVDEEHEILSYESSRSYSSSSDSDSFGNQSILRNLSPLPEQNDEVRSYFLFCLRTFF